MYKMRGLGGSSIWALHSMDSTWTRHRLLQQMLKQRTPLNAETPNPENLNAETRTPGNPKHLSPETRNLKPV